MRVGMQTYQFNSAAQVIEFCRLVGVGYMKAVVDALGA